jgi:hypothetical protein
MIGGIGGSSFDHSGSGIPRGPDAGLQREIKDVKHQIAKLRLANQALWEILRERLSLTNEELDAKIKEVDLRDGLQDGGMTDTGMRCPNCGRVSNSKHAKCLYCGLDFERTSRF